MKNKVIGIVLIALTIESAILAITTTIGDNSKVYFGIDLFIRVQYVLMGYLIFAVLCMIGLHFIFKK